MKASNLQRMTHFGGKASLALAVIAALSLPLVAQAGSFQLPTDNAAGWARANAGGSLFPDDPTAAFNNPAAMALFDAPMIQATGTGIRPSAQFHGSFDDAQGNPVSGGNPNGFGKFVMFPDIAWALPVNDRLTIGGSLTVPYGLISKYNTQWQGRYFGTETSLKSVAASLSAGFKINDQFSMGLGIMAQRTQAELNTVIDAGGTATLLGLPFPPQSADAQLNVNVKKKFAFGYFGGFEVKPTDADSFGFSYHSRVEQRLSGTYDVYGGPLAKLLLTAAPAFGLPAIDPNGGSATTQLNTPAYANLTWLHAFSDRFSAAATGTWTDWSSFKQLALYSNGNELVGLAQDYKDSWSTQIGGDYKLTDQWTLRGGIGYDRSPSNIISRDPRVPDGSRKLLGVGFGYRASDKLSFDLGYQHQFVGKTPVNQTNELALGGGTMNGYFQDSGDVVSMTGTYKF